MFVGVIVYLNYPHKTNETKKEESADVSSSKDSIFYADACDQEKMMHERVYPGCPSDVDAELYDLLLAVLDAQDFHFDMDRYWRCMDVVDMLEEEKKDVTSKKQFTSEYKDQVNTEANNYTADHISSPEIKSMAKSLIKELHRLFNTPKEKFTKTYNMGIVMSRLENLYRSTDAYKSLGSFDDIEGYTQRFYSLLNDSDYTQDAVIVKIRNTNEEDGNIDAVITLQKIIDSSEYNEWLPMVWWRWRYLAGSCFCGFSKDAIVPNWFYNEYRIKCYNTILRYLKNNPTDTIAKVSALLLLEKTDIRIFGGFPFGNQLIEEDFFE